MRVWILFLTSLSVWLNAATPPYARKLLAHLRLSFEASESHGNNQYIAHGEGYTAYLMPSAIIFASKTPIRMDFVGGNRQARMEPLDALQGVSNYYTGSDPARWRVNVPTYGRVKIHDVYPGIDLVFYGNNGELEYDWLVGKGADPFKIRVRYRGTTVRLDSNGDVLLRSANAEIRQRKPRILQEGQPIEGQYEIRGKEISFRVPDYDPTRPLVIDPALVYSTYLNTQVSGPPDAIAVDVVGNVYIVGSTTGLQFHASNSPQPSYGGGVSDAFLLKIDRFGSLVYSTYLGGPGTDYAQGVAVDANGNTYITGSTQGGFPLFNALQSTYGGGTSDVFVAKLQSSTGVLVYSTYLGGPSPDIGGAIAVDSGGSAYITGSAGAGFPVLNAVQPVFGGGLSDVFVAKINPQGGVLVYSTYLGGSHNDRGFAIAVDSRGSAYVTGNTDGVFPVTTNALQIVSGGDVDAFITKLNPQGNALVYSTYLGGRNYDGAFAIAVDSSGQAYLTGTTQGGFPVVNALQATFGGGTDAFVAKINSAGTALIYSTYLGGSGVDNGNGIALDPNGNVFVTGVTDGNFPVTNALQPTFGGIIDVFVAMINRLGSALVYSTYLGGSGQDEGEALALDSTGNVYVTGTTTSPNFPTVKPIQGRGPGSDSFLAVLEPTTAGQPAMSLSRSTLNYGVNGSIVTSPQTIEVSFTAGQAVSWTASSNQPNIAVSPSSGNGRGGFQVSVTGGSSGVITVVAQASNSPQQVQVHIGSVASAGPYGSFDTPSDGAAGISGAIAVTGWALDAIEVSRVDIWREPIGSELPQANGLVYIADADFVPGARPDVEAAFPISPLNYRAGWGYLMLTNGLPGSGNGTYKLHAIAHSTTGLAKELGTRTITVDNAHAAKPFGSIDTPAQGGTVSGNAFVNFGWALTPNPAAIATDGSTITVIVDGAPLGHVTYNQFRSDIAILFPGLANSNGAVGFFYIDTTKLSNGLHTISWNVFDNHGRGDGIGSRYFNVFNNGGVAAPEQTTLAPMPAQGAIVRGRGNRTAQRLEPDANGVLKVDVQELEWIEVDLGASDGCLLVSGEKRALPVGSTLKEGVFYWQVGPGFLGNYEFVFERPRLLDLKLRVTIESKQFR